jgi:ABC-type multidrug transport system fused ATPase/permease subunit
MPETDRPWAYFRIVAPYIKRCWFLVALELVFQTLRAIVNALTGICFGKLTDAAAIASWDSILRTVPSLLLFLALSVLAAFVATASGGLFGSALSRELRADATRRMLKYPYAYFEGHHSGDLVSRLNNDIAQVQYFFQESLGSIIRNPITFLVISIVLARIDFLLLLPTLLITPFTFAMNMRYGKRIQAHYREQQEGYALMTRSIQDTVQGIGLVKSYGLYDAMQERLKKGIATITRNQLGVIGIATNRSYLSNLNRNLPLLITVLWGGWRTIRGELSPGDLFTFFYLYQYLNAAIASITEITAEAQGIRGILGRTNAIWEEPLEREGGLDSRTDTEGEKGGGVLRIEGLGFSYDPDSPLLEGIDLSVRAGETLALVGSSGCGKSTLLKLVCAFLEPDSGGLYLFGRGYGEWSLAGLRSRISLVSQDSFLFPASIGDNIAYGKVGATPGEIEAAASMAGIADFISSLPEGYGTLAGERGVRLSGGQRQRVAIARALLKDAPILVLDEPTSALDAASEAAVQSAVEKLMKGRTVLVAAHRLSTIRGADSILVLEKGRILERGTHDELIESAGAYRRLYRKQISGGEA